MGGGLDERVGLPYGLRHGVECLGDLVRRVAGDIFTHRGAVYVAARPTSSARKALGPLEHIIGDGHGGLHTDSMTADC